MCIELTSGIAYTCMSQWTLSQPSVDDSKIRLYCTRLRFQLNF